MSNVDKKENRRWPKSWKAEKLGLPCPFCGDEEQILLKIKDLPGYESKRDPSFNLRCANSQCHAVPIVTGNCADSCIAKWNTRGRGKE